MLIPTPGDAYRRRWMLFVDGENLAIEGKKAADESGVELREGECYLPGIFVWMPKIHPASNLYENGHLKLQQAAIRAHYYTAMSGSEAQLDEARIKLRSLGFHPEVFRKEKGARSKGVDITLARDMMSHGFHDNYDVAILLAGDGDYVPLVNEVKRMGKVVYLIFFDGPALNPKLDLSADYTVDLKETFIKAWADKSKV